jgi:hypothetical protein
MAVYNRGSIYWYKLIFSGEAIRESKCKKREQNERIQAGQRLVVGWLV